MVPVRVSEPLPVLVKLPPVPAITPALVPPLTDSVVEAPKLTVPPFKVVIVLVVPLKLAVPPDSVPMAAVLPKVVLPTPLKLVSVTVPVDALKLSALVAVLALLTAPRVWPALVKSAVPLAPRVRALVLAKLPPLPMERVPAFTVVRPV